MLLDQVLERHAPSPESKKNRLIDHQICAQKTRGDFLNRPTTFIASAVLRLKASAERTNGNAATPLAGLRSRRCRRHPTAFPASTAPRQMCPPAVPPHQTPKNPHHEPLAAADLRMQFESDPNGPGNPAIHCWETRAYSPPQIPSLLVPPFPSSFGRWEPRRRARAPFPVSRSPDQAAVVWAVPAPLQ